MSPQRFSTAFRLTCSAKHLPQGVPPGGLSTGIILVIPAPQLMLEASKDLHLPVERRSCFTHTANQHHIASISNDNRGNPQLPTALEHPKKWDKFNPTHFPAPHLFLKTHVLEPHFSSQLLAVGFLRPNPHAQNFVSSRDHFWHWSPVETSDTPPLQRVRNSDAEPASHCLFRRILGAGKCTNEPG